MPAYKDEERKSWYASFYYVDWTGERKRKLKRGFKKRQDALDYERNFLQKEAKTSDIEFGNLVENYLEDKSSRLRVTTMETKSNIIETKILPFFENLPINKIKSTHVRKWQNKMIKEGYAPTYLKTINNQLSAIFNYAVRHYGLQENPVHIAGSMGKKNADSMKIWTLDEFNKFIEFEDKPAAKLAFEILFWTGIRSGELLALTPEHILPDKILDINKSYARLKQEDIIDKPKTEKSIRLIPIPDFLYDNIQSYISSLYKIEPDERIFYFTKSFLKKEIERCCKLSGVKEIRVHDLRHSHASLLIELGYDILLISERLGHENVETTWNTYGHLYPNKQVKLASHLNDLQNSITVVSQEENNP
ncbi:site-specific integrase [uncultured Tissierella sp.]|uniref:tyrosine-type recombinase/integrase n=1 Tax=uncultured Tissierella sp. TaxID=448160 RepID=UPI002804A148|nr:site-specific integrase [uncultured Tissierella sp.]MDU5080289.1 site-specific integrase [Bacillota bacterium]